MMATDMIQRNHRFCGELLPPRQDEAEKRQQDEEEAQPDHEPEGDERDEHGRPVRRREILQAFHDRVRVMVGEKAQAPGDLQRLDGVLFLLRAGELQDVEVGALLRLPLRLHGRELRGLVLRHLHAREVARHDDHDRGDDAERGGDPEGPPEHLFLRPAQELDGGYAHDEERGEGVRGGDDVEKLDPGVGASQQRAEGCEHRLAADELVPARPLHPPVGQQDPERGKGARPGHHPHDARVHSARHPLPAEHPHPDERGFEEEGDGGLDGQRGAEDVPDELRVLGPVHSELELQRDPRDHPDREVHQEEPAPVLRHVQERLIPGPCVARLHVGGHHGEPEGERDEEEVEHGNGGKLDPGEYRDAHEPNISWSAGPFNNQMPPCRFLLRDDGHLPLAA